MLAGMGAGGIAAVDKIAGVTGVFAGNGVDCGTPGREPSRAIAVKVALTISDTFWGCATQAVMPSNRKRNNQFIFFMFFLIDENDERRNIVSYKL
jgi:hypothetical protein